MDAGQQGWQCWQLLEQKVASSQVKVKVVCKFFTGVNEDSEDQYTKF